MSVIYRNIIVLEILSQDAKVEGDDVLEYYSPAVDGDFSAAVIGEDHQLIDGPTAAQMLILQGSDPGFFGLED